MAFNVSRGCVYCVRRGSAAYEIDGLNSASCPPIIITGVSPSPSDVVMPALTFGGQSRLFVFGKNMGPVIISGISLLGPRANSDNALRVARFFEEKRVSNSRSTVKISGPDGAFKAFITGYSPGGADLEYNILPFTLSGVISISN